MNTDQASLQPRKLDAGRGWIWLTDAYQLFMGAPGIWIAIVVIYIAIFAAASMAPGGNTITTLFEQVFGGGFMLACAAQASGEKLKIEYLFAGFRGGRIGRLLQLALLYMVALLALAVIGLLLASAMSALPSSQFSAMDIVAPDAMIQKILPQLMGNLPLLLVTLILLALYIPVLMGLWLASALIVLRNQGPVAAFKLSFRACLINFMPFLVYSIATLLLAIVACIPLLLGWLVAAPVFFISVYTTYRDIFPAEPEFRSGVATGENLL